MKKRGQVTIWIIVGIILVASIILFLFLERPPSIDISQSKIVTNSFISSCIEPEISEALNAMLPRGGLIERHSTVRFDNEEIEYLCVNIGFYEPCINQHPLLIQEMENELEEHLRPKMDICFNEIEDYVERAGGELILSPGYKLEVAIVPDAVVLEVNRDTTYKDNFGETATMNDYRIEYSSGAHGLATVALEIAAQEATYCYFESIGYSLYYPRYKVTRHQLSYPIKIYTINDTITDEYMRIAIRSCAMPAGV